MSETKFDPDSFRNSLEKANPDNIAWSRGVVDFITSKAEDRVNDRLKIIVIDKDTKDDGLEKARLDVLSQQLGIDWNMGHVTQLDLGHRGGSPNRRTGAIEKITFDTNIPGIRMEIEFPLVSADNGAQSFFLSAAEPVVNSRD